MGVELARAMMLLATVALVEEFEFELFKTNISDVEFQHDYQVALPRLDSHGVRVMVAIRRE